MPAGPLNSTDFHHHIYPEIFLGLPPVERINFGRIPLLYVFVLCCAVCVCDKSTNPVIQHIITSYTPLKYINNTYYTPYTRQLITICINVDMYGCTLDIYISNVLIQLT